MATDIERVREPLMKLTKSRRLLAHAKSCPALFEGTCACGAQDAADLLSEALRALGPGDEGRDDA
jgi:hypothetical protein